MRYNIGDSFVYPMHGAGTVESIEEKIILGENVSYYNIKLPYGNLLLAVPVENIDKLGVRDVMDVSEVDRLLSYLKCSSVQNNDVWNKRLRSNMDKLRGGNIYAAADVFKELYFRDIERNLSSGEKKVLNSAKNIMYSELVIACGKSMEEIDEMIMGIITSA